MKGRIIAVCRSDRQGEQKKPVERATLVRGWGMEGDAHAGNWHRQISLLEDEKIESMRAKGINLGYGDFGENIVVKGFDLESLDMGRRFHLGSEAVLQMTQLGKECHTPCHIYHTVGDCIMPKYGIFCRVVRGGEVAAGDEIATDDDLDIIRYAVLTLSDRGFAGEREDSSGPLVVEAIEKTLKGKLIKSKILPDDKKALERELISLCDNEVCDLILTTGGTGLSPRDVTPEATLAVIDRQIPGIAEAMRAKGLAFTPNAMLSRSVCGMRGQTIIVNLSGSPKAVSEQLGALTPVLPHALKTASGIPQDCAR